LYRLLEAASAVQTVTFSEYLDGNRTRSVSAHPLLDQTRVYDFYTGSWVDEADSAPGVDLGTWIGDEEENRAWELLAEARRKVAGSGKCSGAAPDAYRSLYAAEGSDWYWWFGSDQYSGRDDEFDDLFRMHLKNVYRGLMLEVPAALDQHIVPHSVTWTFTDQVTKVQPRDRVYCTNQLSRNPQLEDRLRQNREYAIDAGGRSDGRGSPVQPDVRAVFTGRKGINIQFSLHASKL
jgi:alpha-amylase/alpha-mannosidase (GH57 family)